MADFVVKKSIGPEQASADQPAISGSGAEIVRIETAVPWFEADATFGLIVERVEEIGPAVLGKT